jgi:hypothetical protein
MIRTVFSILVAYLLFVATIHHDAAKCDIVTKSYMERLTQ